MRHPTGASLYATAIIFLASLPIAAGSAGAATVVINNNDGPGEGFNDPAVFTPVGGNPAVTLGQARLNAFEFAAEIWGSCLESSVTITIDAEFNALFCDPTSAILGFAGPNTVDRDFGAALPYPAEAANTWYPQALANAMDGSDREPLQTDAGAEFNSAINGSPGCLGGASWYYGFDRNPPGTDIDFVTVLLHELGHALGFLTLLDCGTGSLFLGFPDTYLASMERHGAVPSAFSAMSNAQRVAACTDGPNVHFIGAQVTAEVGTYSAGVSGGHIQLNAPNPHQPGSSLSHFDPALTPDELMEPSYTAASHEISLAFELSEDIGWRLLEQDLWGRDDVADIGDEPNPNLGPMWQSPDIWVRQNQDTTSGVRSTGPVYANEHGHQDAEYKTTGSNYVYVKVRNRGCRNCTDATAELKVYFAKAGTGLSWPADWVGSMVGPVVYGDLIGTVSMPPIPEGEVWVAEVPWTVPDPADFAAFGTDQNHFCLLARVETESASPYGMTTAEGADIHTNTNANNNIWWKNVKIYDLNPFNLVYESRFLVGSSATAGVFDFNFRVPEQQLQDGFLNYGQVKIDLGELFAVWQEAGGEGTGFRRSERDNLLVVIDPAGGAWLRGIPLGAGERKIVGLEFELSEQPQEKKTFDFTVAQFTQGRTEPDGGVTMELRWDPQGTPDDDDADSDGLDWYWWLLLLLILLILLILLLRRK